MSRQALTAEGLFARHERALALRWLAGRSGRDRLLTDESVDAESGRVAWVGHLNLIHPFRIQVLGRLELDYLAALGKNSRTDSLHTLFAARPTMVIIADGGRVDEDFRALAEESGTPLVESARPSSRVISRIQQALSGDFLDRIVIHGVFMEILGIGVLLTGDSGIGKSELALELINRGHRLVADDAPEFRCVAPDVLRGTCPGLLSGYLEVRGLGVLDIRSMFGDSAIKQGKRLSLIIHLQRMTTDDLARVDRIRGSRQERVFLDIEIPQVTIPVAPGHNMAVLAEGAVRNHLLRLKGRDPVQEFIDRQARAIEGRA